MTTIPQDVTRLNLGAKKFVVWLFIVASIMLFAALTSGYIVKKAAGNWLHFTLPPVFIVNTILVILSSITLHWSYLSAKNLRFNQERLGLWVTLGLGVAFLIGQFYAWVFLVQGGVFFSGNPSGSFLYALVLFHGLHIFAGLALLISALLGSSPKIPQVINVFRMERASIFWHFLDILWIYLYVFLLLNQ
jgi:cytochrome c oxidase subunit III